MKRKLSIIIFTFISCILSACAKAEETHVEVSENIERETIESENIEQESSTEIIIEEELPYPILLTTTLTTRIDFAIESEDIFCIYDGEKYGYMKLTGEEITDYIYEAAFPFSEGLACAMLDGKYGFIDTDGKEAIPFIYENAAPFSEGLAYFSAEDTYGFMTKDGETAFYLDCDSVSSFREGLAYFSIDGKYGYIDKNGEIAIEPVYSDADYFKNGIAFVNIDGCKGAINTKGEEVIPVIYDHIYWNENYIITETGAEKEYYLVNGDHVSKTSDESVQAEENGEILEKLKSTYDYVGNFYHGRAEVFDGTYYGVVDEQGELLIPLEHSDVRVFEDGSYLLDNELLYNYDHELIYHATTRSPSLNGDFYEIEQDEGLLLIDKNGQTVLSVAFEYNTHDIYGDYSNYVLTQYDGTDQILIISNQDDIDLSDILLKNSITPRIELYWKATYGENIEIENDNQEVTQTQQFTSWCKDNYIKKARLYDAENSGVPILYCYEKPVISYMCAMSESSLCSIQDDHLKLLVTGYECGGTARGDYVCFWREQESGEVLIGYKGAAGGFGGYAGYGAAFNYESGEKQEKYSYQYIWQTIGNYEQEELLENAELFYDDNDVPYTQETIQSAEYVNEYLINDERVTVEEYQNAYRQYVYMDLFT